MLNFVYIIFTMYDLIKFVLKTICSCLLQILVWVTIIYLLLTYYSLVGNVLPKILNDMVHIIYVLIRNKSMTTAFELNSWMVHFDKHNEWLSILTTLLNDSTFDFWSYSYMPIFYFVGCTCIYTINDNLSWSTKTSTIYCMTPIEFLTLILDIYLVIIYINFLSTSRWLQEVHWTLFGFIFIVITIGINLIVDYILDE